MKIKELKSIPMNKFTNQTMKNVYKTFLIITLLIGSSACSVNDSGEDENFFVVPFEPIVPVNQLADGSYNISNGAFHASFSERANAKGYEFVIVREDGSKSEPSTRTLNQLVIVDGTVSFVVVIGTPYTGFGISEAEKNKLLKQFQEALDAAKPRYKEVEVTVIE